MMRNPLEIIDIAIQHYEEGLKAREVLDDPERLSNHHAVIRALSVLRDSLEIEYFPFGELTTLGAIRPGAVFAMVDGVYAVKSEYHYNNVDPIADSNGVNCTCQCILLSSGEYAHFKDGNAAPVYEVVMPRGKEEE